MTTWGPSAVFDALQWCMTSRWVPPGAPIKWITLTALRDLKRVKDSKAD